MFRGSADTADAPRLPDPALTPTPTPVAHPGHLLMAPADRPDTRAGAARNASASGALPAGRGTELLLLAFAAIVVTGALVLVEANQEQELTTALLYVGAAYLGLFTVAHFAVRWLALRRPTDAAMRRAPQRPRAGDDPPPRPRRAGAAIQLGREVPSELISRQVAWTAVGLTLFVAVLWLVRDHRTLARYAYTAGFAGIVLLALPGLLPSSISEVNGAKIWLRLGVASIQPGEFAKILLIIFFSAFLVQKRELFTTAGRRFLGMELPRALAAPRCSSRGGSRSACSFSSATWAPRCCSSGSCW